MPSSADRTSAEDAAGPDPDYFARLLEKGVLAAADPRKGRFRAFLRTDCGYFLAELARPPDVP